MNIHTGNMMNSMLHMKSVHKYSCEKCRFSTRDPNKFKNHVSLHNDIKYACSRCTFISYSKTEFQKHLVSHTGKFPYTCDYCGYGAIRNDYIVKHIKRIHGDGKIQCSVSTIENESKNASVNITQTQVRSSIQDILQKNPFLNEEVIDLTNNANNLISGNRLHFNGNNAGNVPVGQVEVKVISPVDQTLHPWMPLLVVAPQAFKVPSNCIAQVMEVKSMNNTCNLVLKCVEQIVPNCIGKKENASEPKSLESIVSPVKRLENLDRSSLQECTALTNGCDDSILHTHTTVTGTGEESNSNKTCPLSNYNGTINTVKGISDGIINDLESGTEGPIISSVFSLSSDSQNIIEGIQWECPSTVSETFSSHDMVDTPTTPGITCESHHGVAELSIESKWQSDKHCQTNMLKPDPDSLVPVTNVYTQNVKIEIQLPDCKPTLLHDQKPDSLPYDLLHRYSKGRRKSSRLSKLESNMFSRPKTLFLSCDKRIVMQPVSCVMQNGNHTANPVLAVHKATNQESAILKKVKKKNPKAKAKTFPKRLPKTLRLFPVISDQLIHTPSSNQPVVVLNHPDLESLEISYLMKAIGMFKGEVAKITLSKQMCRKKGR